MISHIGERLAQLKEQREWDEASQGGDPADHATGTGDDGSGLAHIPSVISLGQVWVDIMMNVDELPSSGGFAVAEAAHPSVGGSYRVLDAASRMGAPAEHAGIIGNGVWASMIRDAYEHAGIAHVGPSRLDADSGFRLVFHDGDGRKTFVAHYGAEAGGDEHTFEALEPDAGDVVHISGNTLLDHTAAGIDEFMDFAGTDPKARDYRLVINPTNTLKLVNDHLLEDLVLARPIWSCNRQEAGTLAERLGVVLDDDAALTVGGGFDEAMNALCEALGSTLRAPLVVRAGSRGAWVREPGGGTVHVEGYPTKGVHTRSAGSCHTGAMCAMLARGWSLPDAVNIANAAASLAIQRSVSGVPVCPTAEEAIALAGVSTDGRSDGTADGSSDNRSEA
ncbi:PfkB family carbohydrate kinase [Bifidobacterium saguinibicoloris]|uniref:PfkB family carbohydrate kinase n=1 Tax=Bifidobacterium saguinibicoloris TaxID=2834433 RepID=UPI001C5A1453|nr:PfkB family carbohydrate kinase [Bifidobacterium saguinibicoloris]MBW3080233.1 sugar kinase [Bifidobacterium saguinibicoloris]